MKAMPTNSRAIDRKSQPAKFDIPAIKLYGKKIISIIEFLEFAPIKLPKKQCKIEINIVILKALFLIFTYNNFS